MPSRKQKQMYIQMVGRGLKNDRSLNPTEAEMLVWADESLR